MASFSSGIMISRSEAERRKGDEMRMRKHGLDPSKDASNWGGAVVSRRVHKAPRKAGNADSDKEKEEADALPMDHAAVLAKSPQSRLKWLQRALVLASKGRVPVAQIYDIIQHSKIASGVNAGLGKQMMSVLQANMHLFSPKQQRVLQSGSLSVFSERRDSPPPDCERDRGGGGRRNDAQSRSRSRSRSREARRASAGRSRGSRSRSRSQRGCSSSRSRSRGASRARPRARAVSEARGAAATRAPGREARRPAQKAAAAADEPPERLRRSPPPEAAEPAPRAALKMKMTLQPWQPHCLRVASELPPGSG